MSATIASAVKTAMLALSDENARKKIGWVVAAILSPVILLVAFFCSLGSGAADHNRSAVELCFYGGTVPAGVPAEYRACIEEMRNALTQLDQQAIRLVGKACGIPRATTEEHLRTINTAKDEVRRKNAGEEIEQSVIPEEIVPNWMPMDIHETVMAIFEASLYLEHEEERCALYATANFLLEAQSYEDWLVNLAGGSSRSKTTCLKQQHTNESRHTSVWRLSLFPHRCHPCRSVCPLSKRGGIPAPSR